MSVEALELDGDISSAVIADLTLSETTCWNGRDVNLSSISQERTKELFFQAICEHKQTRVITFSAEVGDNEEGSVDSDVEKPYSNEEILNDIGSGVGHSAAAGIAAAGGLPGIPVAIVEVYYGSKCFIEAAKKYNENELIPLIS